MLSACSVFQKDQTSELAPNYQWKQVEAELLAIKSWEILGKAGIRTPEENLTVAINRWVQLGDHFNLQLSSTFFGLGSTQVSGDPNQILLEQGDDSPIYSNEPNALIEEALGIPLPITYLNYWIRALPEPTSDFERTFSENHLPSSISQRDWSIQYKKYTEVNGTPLPSKLILSSATARIVLAVKQWQPKRVTPLKHLTP